MSDLGLWFIATALNLFISGVLCARFIIWRKDINKGREINFDY